MMYDFRMRNKEVQVIPWFIADSGYVRCQSQRLDPQKTVFVGALHGMLNAEGLCNIFNDLFGGVVYAGIFLANIHSIYLSPLCKNYFHILTAGRSTLSSRH